jgi:hypothetical protein
MLEVVSKCTIKMSNFDILWHYLPVSFLDLQVWPAECTIKMMREKGWLFVFSFVQIFI